MGTASQNMDSRAPGTGKRLLVDANRAGVGDLICLSSSLAVLAKSWRITVIGKEKNLHVLDLFDCVESYSESGQYDWRVRLALPDGGNRLNKVHLVEAFAVQFGLSRDDPEPPKVKRPHAQVREDPAHLRIAIAVDSGRPNKTWPQVRFAEVTSRLASEFHITQLGQGEVLPGVDEDARGILLFPQLARRLASSSLFLGCDSGLAHLAAAVRTPSVIIYGATHPKYYSYRLQNCIYNENGCHGCFNLLESHSKEAVTGCPKGRNFECLTSINAEQVIATVRRLMRPERILSSPIEPGSAGQERTRTCRR